MKPEAWQQLSNPALSVRRYASYRQYVRHQRSKLRKLNLSQYEPAFQAALTDRLRQNPDIKRGSSVLCLGARGGAEVRSFLAVGCFAVGIDLNPGRHNHFVLHGDFHALQFASASVDIVYTNALDHVLYIEKLILEVERVLKDAGLFIIDAVRGTGQGIPPGEYESLEWSSISELTEVFTSRSFDVVQRYPIKNPWGGEHIVLRYKPETSVRGAD